MNTDKRRFRRLAAVVIGLVIGVVLGLALGWVVWPIQYTEANPAILREDYRRDYAFMIAIIYAEDEDLTAAQQRLSRLGANNHDYLLDLTAELIVAGENEAIVRPLAHLSADLGLTSPALIPYLTPPE